MAKQKGLDEWVLEALEGAIADPAPRKLHGTKASPGIFLSSAAPAKSAAQKCLQEGLLRAAGEVSKGKTRIPLYALSPQGLAYVLARAPAARALSAAAEAADRTARSVAECGRSLDQLRQQAADLKTVVQQAVARVEPPDVENVLRKLQASGANGDASGPSASSVQFAAPATDCAEAAGTYLRQRRARLPLQSCPLPELYQQCRARQPELTIGQFHDALRRLSGEKRLKLLPFTQALYQLPEPEFALLAGREVMYYAEPL